MQMLEAHDWDARHAGHEADILALCRKRQRRWQPLTRRPVCTSTSRTRRATCAACWVRERFALHGFFRICRLYLSCAHGRLATDIDYIKQVTLFSKFMCQAEYGAVRTQDDRSARPGAIFLDCYDSRGRVPEELTQPPFLSACLQVSSAWPNVLSFREHVMNGL